MAQMVGPELQLEPFGGVLAASGPHHSGVGQQRIDGPPRGQQVHRLSDGLQPGQIEFLELDPCLRDLVPDRRNRRPGFLLVARGHHDGRTGGGELLAGKIAEAGVSAGDNDRAAAQIRQVGGVPVIHSPRLGAVTTRHPVVEGEHRWIVLIRSKWCPPAGWPWCRRRRHPPARRTSSPVDRPDRTAHPGCCRSATRWGRCRRRG